MCRHVSARVCMPWSAGCRCACGSEGRKLPRSLVPPLSCKITRAQRRARAAVVPCCYGQLFGSTDHERGSGSAPQMHPRSYAFRDALNHEAAVEAFRQVMQCRLRSLRASTVRAARAHGVSARRALRDAGAWRNQKGIAIRRCELARTPMPGGFCRRPRRRQGGRFRHGWAAVRCRDKVHALR